MTALLQNVALALLLVTAAGCSDPDAPETQVRKVIGQMEAAAEARDAGDLMAFISPNYRDAAGRDREEAARYLRGYFLTRQSVHLLTRIESVEFPVEDEARATVLVGMAGRGAGSAASWDLAADLYEFQVTLAREGRDWKVTYARWQRTASTRL